MSFVKKPKSDFLKFLPVLLLLTLIAPMTSGGLRGDVQVSYKYNPEVSGSLSLVEKNGDVFNIAISPDGKFLVYSRLENMPNESGMTHIWLIDLTTLVKTDLMHDNNGYHSPVFINDSTITFTRSVSGGNPTIWTLNLKTNVSRQIVPQDGFVARGPPNKILFHPIPTGRQNFSPLAPFNIWLLDSDGKNPVQLTSEENVSKDFIWGPSLGFHDEKILFLKSGGMWTMDFAGKNKSKIINESVSIADYSASKSEILFLSWYDNELWVLSNLENLEREVSRDDTFNISSGFSSTFSGLTRIGSFSPQPLDLALTHDGSALFFVGMTPEGKQGIYMLKLKNASLQSSPLPPSPHSTPSPQVAPRPTPGFEATAAVIALISGLAFVLSKNSLNQGRR